MSATQQDPFAAAQVTGVVRGYHEGSDVGLAYRTGEVAAAEEGKTLQAEGRAILAALFHEGAPCSAIIAPGGKFRITRASVVLRTTRGWEALPVVTGYAGRSVAADETLHLTCAVPVLFSGSVALVVEGYYL